MIKNKINKKKILTIILISLIVILFLTGFSLGKELSGIKIEAKAEIAKPILVVDNSEKINVTTIDNDKYYEFTIKNYNELGEVSDVVLNYNIEIITQENKAIEYKLYKEEKEIELTNNKTEDMQLSKAEKQEDKYKLEIIFDKTKADDITEIMQDVQIKVHSEQIKI